MLFWAKYYIIFNKRKIGEEDKEKELFILGSRLWEFLVTKHLL